MRLGVISDLGLEQLASYYFAARNVFEDVGLITGKDDLKNFDAILCGNDHYQKHRDIWERDDFIEEANKLGLPFFAHTVEHIQSPYYPWNLKIQHNLQRFKNLRQRCWDTQDATKYKTKIARGMFSKNHMDDFEPCQTKKNKAIFIGKLYADRIMLLQELQKTIEVDVFERTELPYFKFLSKLAQYRFVVCPLSLASDGIPGRFYEALAVGSIPIQEAKDSTLEHYRMEAGFVDAIFFKDANEVKDKIARCNLSGTTNKMYLEAEIADFVC